MIAVLPPPARCPADVSGAVTGHVFRPVLDGAGSEGGRR